MRFSTKELVDIAIGIEESGYYFYTQSRKKFTDPNFTDLLAFLAEEELRHKELFEKMLGELSDTSGIFTEDYFQYIKSLGDERVFKNNDDVDAAVKTVQSIFDVLKIAMAAEKDSILFYYELRDVLPENMFSLVNSILVEEKRHLLQLGSIKNNIADAR